MYNKTLYTIWLIAIPLILLGYFFWDKNISTFVYTHHWRAFFLHVPGLKQLVEWPSLISNIAPIVFFFILLFTKNTSTTWKKMLLNVCLSVFLTYLFKNDLKWVFSRHWPETWINGNLSWIDNQAYGFQWFEGKPFTGTDATGAFPSGHSAVAFAALIPIGLFYRSWLKICALLATLTAASMVVFDYHFLSDAIAGATVGITCALLCYRWMEK